MDLFEPPATLNTVITGQLCCGDRYLAAALCDHPKITCHSVLLDSDDSVRRYYHESYFGDTGTTPDWLVEGHISGEQYLTNKIFDNPLREEEVIGVSVLYPHLYARDLWDYFSNWCRVGDFCVINLKRNPIACFASLKVWERDGNSLSKPSVTKFNRGYTEIVGHPSTLPVEFPRRATPVHANLEELYAFVRMHMAADRKVADMCEDRLELTYEELVTNFIEVCPAVFSFLDRKPLPIRTIRKWSSSFSKLGRTPIHRMLSNWNAVCREAPSDIQVWLNPEDI